MKMGCEGCTVLTTASFIFIVHLYRTQQYNLLNRISIPHSLSFSGEKKEKKRRDQIQKNHLFTNQTSRLSGNNLIAVSFS